jgi:hypothetical protein
MYFRFLSCLCGILVHPSGFRHKLCGERASTDEISSDPMSIDIFEIPVHPAADKFPMMEEEELDELAQDIKANGLQQPLVVAEVDGQMMLIDGRTRRMACRPWG